MFENLLNGITSPVFILFLLILVGYFFGKIKIKDISMDLAGVLIISILFGMLLSLFPLGTQYISKNADELKLLSSLGTALFVASIGLSAGYDFSAKRSEKTMLYFIIGVIGVALNMLLAYLISCIDIRINKYMLFGLFCGSMTTTPGLAAICEGDSVNAEIAAAGYAVAYLFGVMGVVLFVQIKAAKEKGKTAPQKTNETVIYNKKAELNGIVQIAVVIAIGYILGNLEFPIIEFSLGNSGGILIAGMIVGFFLSKKSNIGIPKENLSLIRNLGLLIFFVGTGIPAGTRLLQNIELTNILFAIVFVAFPIWISYFIAKKVDGNSATALSIVCGVMTSTPAIGILIKNKNTKADITAYSITYSGALLAIVIGIRLLLK